MNGESHQMTRDEQALREVFDATAGRPSTAQLQRLARAAAAVPDGAVGRTTSGLSAWRWPALALAATGVMALGAATWMQPGQQAETLRGGALALGTAALTTPHTGASESPAPPPVGSDGTDDANLLEEVASTWLEIDDAEPEEAPLVQIDPLAALDLGGSGFDPLAPLDLLHPPDDPATLARWTAALEQIAGPLDRGG